MSDADSSDLSSPPLSELEDEPVNPFTLAKKKTKSKPKSKRKVEDDDESPEESSPAKKKRAPSPPHDPVFADNADIAFIVMFRSRFDAAFPTKFIQLGPQDIERGVVDPVPSQHVERLLCVLLGLVLNRKKYVELGHYGRALEEAIQTQKHQWPRLWEGKNPLSGGHTFNAMSPLERVNLLKTLTLWSLNESLVIKNIIKDSYKQSRHDDDLNQPLSVQPFGRDGDKRRYWLIEGKTETAFRLYRESNPALKRTNEWISVAGNVDELRIQALKLGEEGSQAARRLSDRINVAIPRFEASAEKVKRREWRIKDRNRWTRPEIGTGIYEGRTRGAKKNYAEIFSGGEEDFSTDGGIERRSTRRSGRNTSAEPSGPTVTASGRQVRSRHGGMYGESLLSGQTTTDHDTPATGDYVRSDNSEDPERPTHSRATRAAGRSTANGILRNSRNIDDYNSADDMDDEEDDAESSGNGWGDGDDEDDEVRARDVTDDEDDSMSDAPQDGPQKLVTVLRYGKGKDINGQSASSPVVEIPKTKYAVSSNGSGPTTTNDYIAPPAPQTNGVPPLNGHALTAAPVYAPEQSIQQDLKSVNILQKPSTGITPLPVSSNEAGQLLAADSEPPSEKPHVPSIEFMTNH